MNRNHPPRYPRYQINPEGPRWTDAVCRAIALAVFAVVVVVVLRAAK